MIDTHMPDTRQDISLSLAARTVNGKARQAALAVAGNTEREPAGIVSYVSAGRVLILGDGPAVLEAAQQLGTHADLNCMIISDAAGQESPDAEPGGPDAPARVCARVSGLHGYLGDFRVELAAAGGAAKIRDAAAGRETFDLVLDLSNPPWLRSALPPPGYFAPGDDPAALQQALDELPDMVGEFEKPQYFQYNASICAHGRSGITACTRCLDTCPADAIVSVGDAIEVNPNLCQGAGSCATACPTGAISYGYPRLGDTLQRLRLTLQAYREAGGADVQLLLHDAEAGREQVARVSAQLPENVLPVELEELGSAGLDVWLAALAYGAATVVLLGTPQLPASVASEIETQLGSAHALLEGMGYSRQRLVFTRLEDAALLDALAGLSPGAGHEPAGFAGLDEKRTVIRLALEYLHAAAPAPRPLVSLPAGAPFGEVLVDPARCTLCMACVSQCPAQALSAGDEKPQLNFIEANCVQCGLCCRTCPEDAIAASPRYLYDFQQRSTVRVLNEEEPFCCVVCGKPFATRSVIERISARMRGHAMFQGDALARIRMCEDCRVKDIYAIDKNRDLSQPPGGMQ